MPAKVAAAMISVLCVGFEAIPRHLLNSLEKFSRNLSSAEAKGRRPLHLSPGLVHGPGARGLGKSHQKSPGGGGPGFPRKKKWVTPRAA